MLRSWENMLFSQYLSQSTQVEWVQAELMLGNNPSRNGQGNTS